MAVGLGIGDQHEAVELPETADPLYLVMFASTEGLSTPAVFSELDRGRAAGDYERFSELEVPAALRRRGGYAVAVTAPDAGAQVLSW